MRLAKRALDLPLPLPLLLVAAITLTAAVPLLSPARAAGLIAPVPVEADEQEAAKATWPRLCACSDR
jgi:hypothetical protein